MSGTKFTFKANRNLGRHGWLRLTPAYSVSLVEELVKDLDSNDLVLDPFCGTGTTALVCAQRGIPSVTTEINPFLVWFAQAKTRPYSEHDILETVAAVDSLETASQSAEPWSPPMQYIDRWWSEPVLLQLGKLWRAIQESGLRSNALDLVKIAFCQTLMEHSRANFRHQSISLKGDISLELSKDTTAQTAIIHSFRHAVELIAEQTRTTTIDQIPEVRLHDSRLPVATQNRLGLPARFTAVITSPPYANRMSYIRELRPYMYWLGFLESGREAGNLDWEAIGGTWGSATSNLTKWEPASSPITDAVILNAIDAIESQSLILGRYVRRYIEDTAEHLRALKQTLAPGARVTYIVGNSRFYDSMLDTERIYAELFTAIGLNDVDITTLRKRTSKKELFEFAVTGRSPR